MFRRLSEPLPLSEASLLLLRPALNTPVLNVGYLPVGPARAAVVAFAEEYGGIGIALGLRSSESGQIVVLRNQESIDFDAPLAEALEPLLDAAERMGFLFDEDMLQLVPGPKGRSDAMVHWAVLMGGMERLLAPVAARSQSQAESEDGEEGGPLSPSLAVEESQYPELILDDVAPLVLPSAALAEERAEDETFDEDPAVVVGAMRAPDRATGVEEDLDETLEEVLDEALADGFGQELDVDDSDWDLADPLLSELDLTQPTAPILVPRPPRPSRSPVVASIPRPVRAAKPPPPPPAVTAEPIATAMPRPPVSISPPPPAIVAAPRVVLSKFRHVEADASPDPSKATKSEVGADRSAELARIPIVRIRRETEKKVPFLARLLSSF